MGSPYLNQPFARAYEEEKKKRLEEAVTWKDKLAALASVFPSGSAIAELFPQESKPPTPQVAGSGGTFDPNFKLPQMYPGQPEPPPAGWHPPMLLPGQEMQDPTDSTAAALWGKEYEPDPNAVITRGALGGPLLTNQFPGDPNKGLALPGDPSNELLAEQSQLRDEMGNVVTIGGNRRGMGAFTPAPAMPSETLGWSTVMDNPDLSPGVKEAWKQNYREKMAADALALGVDQGRAEAELKRAQAGLYGAQAEAVKDPRAGTTLQVMEYVRQNADQFPQIEAGTMPKFRELVGNFVNLRPNTVITIEQVEKILGADKARKLMELAREMALQDFVMSQHITLQAAMFRNPNYGLGSL